jgi:hypothetical protein
MDKEQYFLIWCLETMKRNKDVSGCVIYNKLRTCGALDYILKFYDTIHTEGEHATILDLEESCRVRGMVI